MDTKRVDYIDVAPDDARYIVAGASAKFDRIDGLQTGVFVSRDSGHTFKQENDGLSMTRLCFLKFHPSDKNQIFVGTGGADLFHGSGVVETEDQEAIVGIIFDFGGMISWKDFVTDLLFDVIPRTLLFFLTLFSVFDCGLNRIAMK